MMKYLILVYLCLISIYSCTSLEISTKKSTLLTDKFWTYTSPFLSYPTKIRYKSASESEDLKSSKYPNVVFLHGFGGNSDQFRENMPSMQNNGYNSFAMDLLGYGYSDKPNPRDYPVNSIYNFENWADQTVEFVRDVVKSPTYLVCNSVGGVVGLQAALQAPDLIKGVILINISMRMLHVTKQPPLARPFISAFQTFLRETPVGELFFSQVAQKEALRNILAQAYAVSPPSKLQDEVVDIILRPGLLPGAAAVFLDFISYSGGPLPEELLAKVQCPVRILWGENDPWEPIEMGRQYGNFQCVDSFVPLPGAGHCPMDQVPEAVNSQVLDFLRTHSGAAA